MKVKTRKVSGYKKERNEQIILMRIEGFSYSDIASKFLISCSRARQVCFKYAYRILGKQDANHRFLPKVSKAWGFREKDRR